MRSFFQLFYPDPFVYSSIITASTVNESRIEGGGGKVEVEVEEEVKLELKEEVQVEVEVELEVCL